MRIAVAYDQGQVFQHFGRTEFFKVYEVENGQVISGIVTGTEGIGHEALAGLLSGKGIDVLICGGMGQGAQNALAAAGIEVYSGVRGDSDRAVEQYLKGQLTSAGVNCDHHDHDAEEEHACGCQDSCGDGCGSSCGGCSGCGDRPVILEGRNAGKVCRVHYRGTFNDGSQFDSSYDRGEPLEFVCGTGMMIPGFDKAVVDMEQGQIAEIHLMPEEAYGMPDPNAIFSVKVSELPGAEGLRPGQQVYLQSMTGEAFPVRVTALVGDTITFDANHEMAGKELNFRIELLSAE